MSGAPAITTFPLRGTFPRIEIASPASAPWSEAHEQAWQRSCAANPRLHDGPIWSATQADANRLTVQFDRYKPLTIQ